MSTNTVSLEQEWLETLVHAKPKARREEIFNNDDISKIQEGVTFEMNKIDAGVLAALKKSVGRKNTMSSMHKDVMQAIDTDEDLPGLESISKEDLKKAGEALRKISEVSEPKRLEFRAAKFEEAGYPPDKLSQMREAVKNDPPTLTEKQIKEFNDLSEKVEEQANAEVAEEVWSPLVRQGVLPENLVPNRYSEVKRTFGGASKAYQERLEEHSKDLDENSNLLNKLGVGQDILEKTAKLGQDILKVVPTGSKEIMEHVNLALELLPMASATVITTTEQVIQKKDPQDVVDGVLKGVAGICAKAIPDKGISAIVSGSIYGAIAGGRVVRGIVNKDPKAALDALATAANSALTTAGAATGNKDLKALTPMVVGVIKTSTQAANFIKAVKEGKEAEIKKALAELLETGIDTIGQGVQTAVSAGVEDEDQAETINKAVELASSAAAELSKAALSDEGKAAKFAAALGGIANGCCKAYLKPDELGASVGALINTSVGKAGPALAKSIVAKEPMKVLESLGEIAENSLTVAAAAVPSEEAKEKLEMAAKQLKASVATLGGAAELITAIKDQKLDDIPKAAQKFFSAVAEQIKESVPELAKVDLSGDSDKEGEEGKKDDAAEDDKAPEQDKKVLAALKKTITEQDAKLKEFLKVAKPNEKQKEEAKKAAWDLAAAQKELKEFREMRKELDEDAADFLNLTEEDLDDEEGDGTPPRKLQDLILQLQKDKKIFQLVETLSSMPLNVAAKFFPPAGAALDFKKFAFEVGKAVQHARALLEWLDNAADAKAAVSVQVHAMLSRVGMEKRQSVEHAINAALSLTAAVGQVVTTVGAHAAPVGVAITAGARAGESLAALAKVGIDQAEMARGWQKYQEALKNPGSRKAARRALQENPTLAKYSLAWGALEGGDAIAKSALKKCGLTAAVLSQKDANVKEVQRFLEVMYSEDVVVLRAVPKKQAWYPSNRPALSFRSWTAFLGKAVTDAKPPVVKGSGGAVSEAFAVLEDAEQGYKASETKATEAAKLYEELKKDLENWGKSKAEVVTAEETLEKRNVELEKAKKKYQQSQEAYSKNPESDPDLKYIAYCKDEMGDAEKKRDEAARGSEAAKKKVEEWKKKWEGANENLSKTQEERTQASTELKQAIEAVQSAARGFKPLNGTDGKEHAEMREYLDALVALGDLRLREMAGEVVGLDMSDATE